MNILKQSTAATIKLGPFIDDGDGKSAETGLTISQADIRLSKNGGDIAQTNNSAGATHDELGYYNVPLDTTDTNTLGRLLVAVHESGALPVWKEFLVVTANVYDTLCSTDSLDVNVTALADDVITAGKFDESTAYPLKSADTGNTQVARVGADSDTLETLSDEIAAVKAETAAILVDTGTDGVVVASGQTVATVTNLTNLPTMPADWVTASGLKADAVTEIQSGLAKTTDIPSDYAKAGDAMTLTAAYDNAKDDVLTPLATVDSIVDAIKAKTDNLPASPAATGAAMTLTSAYDAAKTAATQASVNAIPTTPLLAANYTAPDNASITAIKAKTDLIPATPAQAGEYTAAIAAVKSVADDILVDTGTTLDTKINTIDGIVDDILVDTGTTIPATLITIDNFIDTEVAAILEDTGTTIPATLATLATSAALATVDANVDAILDDTGTSGVPLTATAIDAILDEVVVGSYTMRQLLKVMAAALAGKATGGGTTAVTFRGVDDTSDVIVATVDANGNRSAVTLTV